MDEFRDQCAIGFSCEDKLAGSLVDCEVGGKVAQAALCMGGGGGNLLLGRGYDALALFFNRGFDANFVVLRFCFNLGANRCNLVVEF